MESFITNLKNKLMLPGSDQTKEERRNPPNIPMPDIEKISSGDTSSHTDQQKPDVTPIQNDTDNTSTKVSSKSNFNVLLKSFGSKEKLEEDEPSYVPNPIEDDIFIYYD